MSDFAGRWFTTFGPMLLEQQGARVTGSYQAGPDECSVEGEVRDGKLFFRYREAAVEGEGHFELVRHGKFVGMWHADGDEGWQSWSGERGFDGVWETSFGLMRLVQGPDGAHGFYGMGATAVVEGEVEGERLSFRYREPGVEGEGWFDLSPDGRTFQGEWCPDGAARWGPWRGRRARPRPGLTWLVVLEAHWQLHLAEREYSFGFMLGELFARPPGVEVRHRFFDDEAGLARWCRELLFLTEPVALLLAAHGTAEGLSVYGGTVGAAALAEPLSYVDDLLLLHFSACLTMQAGPEGEFLKALRAAVRCPISGYVTSVDWAASAQLEFLYLDMVLARGLPPAEAAAQLPRLLTFAGDEAPPGSPYAPAGFRVLVPGANGGRRL